MKTLAVHSKAKMLTGASNEFNWFWVQVTWYFRIKHPIIHYQSSCSVLLCLGGASDVAFLQMQEESCSHPELPMWEVMIMPRFPRVADDEYSTNIHLVNGIDRYMNG